MDASDDSTVTSYGELLGAFAYTAPEQIRDAHAADHRSDIYSLGCVFYHCLTGQPPRASKRSGEDTRGSDLPIVAGDSAGDRDNPRSNARPGAR